MRTKKKSSKIVVALMAVMVMAAGAMVTANASYTDTDFIFNLTSNSNGWDDTEARSKEDYTSSYMKCNSTNAPYIGSVYGSNVHYMSNDCSHGYKYTFSSGTTKYLKNWVREEGYTLARIMANWSNPGTTVNATGVWSPDSI